MTVLIITHSADNDSIKRVCQAIRSQGERVFRLDTDRFPTDIQLDVYYGEGTEQLTLISEQEQLNLSDVSAVWYRRIAIGKTIPTTMDKQLRQASVEESRATIQGLIASLNVFHLDPFPQIQRAKNKQLQLQTAQKIGLKTPRTLITNRPEAVQQFARECGGNIVTKMLSSFAVYEEGKEKVVFTTPVAPEDLHHLQGLRYCPMTFQENIPKAVELRITIVGNQVFAAAINSQKLNRARYDWRREGLSLIDDWEAYSLPQAISQKLLNLMNYLGLNYGAIDLIVTPDGEYIFLEVNPVGEFFWLDLLPGLPISQAIADILVQPLKFQRA